MQRASVFPKMAFEEECSFKGQESRSGAGGEKLGPFKKPVSGRLCSPGGNESLSTYMACWVSLATLSTQPIPRAVYKPI